MNGDWNRELLKVDVNNHQFLARLFCCPPVLDEDELAVVLLEGGNSVDGLGNANTSIGPKSLSSKF